MTYDELVKRIKVGSGRTDATTLNAIPDFIDAAQSYLDSKLRIQAMIEWREFELGDVRIVPDDSLQIDEVIIGGLSGRLVDLTTLLKSRGVVDECPDAISECDDWYAMNAGGVEIVIPTRVGLYCYVKPVRLSASVQSSAYALGAPNALYWLSLSYLSAFARDSEGASTWMTLANGEIDNLNAAREASRYVGQAARVATKPTQSERYF